MIKNVKLKGFDYVWLVYLIIIYTFNCAFDNMQMLSTIALFLLSVIRYVFKGNLLKLITFKDKKQTTWYFVFFAFVCLSYLWTFSGGRNHSNVATAIIQILVFLYCIDLNVCTQRDISALVKCFCYSTLFFAVVVFVTSPVSTYNSLEFGSFTGMHRNTTGYVMMFACMFDLYFGKLFNRKIYYYMAAFCGLVSLLTGSRKIIIGYAVALFIWMLLQKDLKKVFKYVVIGAVVLAIALPIGFKIPYIRDTFGERMLSIFDDSIEDGSVAARDQAAEVAKMLFAQNPITGHGWNAVASRYLWYYDADFGIYAHNNYLEVGACFGIIGLFLFYRKFIADGYRLLKKANKRKFARFLFACLAVILVVDIGQITYLYLYMISIYSVMFKCIDVEKMEEIHEKRNREFVL